MTHIGRGLASLAVCGLAAWSMHVSGGSTGVGWGIFGLFIIWANV